MRTWGRILGVTAFCYAVAGAGAARAATPLIKVGENHTVMLRSNGTIWTCGDNLLGQLGDGTTTARNVPVQVGTATDWMALAAGEHHTLALKTDGSLWAWGDNTYGQLGTNQATLVQTLPTQVGTDKNWKTVAAGDYHSLALKTDGTIWAWGDSADGTLGTGETYSGIIVAVPTQVGADTDWVAVFAGPDHTVALKADGTLWGWGANGVGQLGDRTNLEGRDPVRIGTDSDWASITARGDQTLAIKKDGRLFAWGLNADGQLGLPTAVDPATGLISANRDFPTQVNADVDWSIVAAGKGHTVALKKDGTLWSWGNNADGQLGGGVTRNVPQQVGAATNWALIDAGEAHSVAMKTNSTVWEMGDNTFGQLCNGTNTANLAPAPGVTPTSGDMDLDGDVGIADALRALRVAIGLSSAVSTEVLAGDVGPLAANGLPNPDGAVTIADAIVILRKITGIVSF